MRNSRSARAIIRLTSAADRRWGWPRLPKPLALLTLTGIRMKLRRENLFDPARDPESDSQAGSEGEVPWGPNPLANDRLLVRRFDGTGNDTTFPEMGSAHTPFARNVPRADSYPDRVLEPNPRLVSNELLARKQFIPATSLNVLAAAWLQFEVHDWMSHGFNPTDDQFEIDLDAGDPWTHERPMRIERTRPDPATTDGGPPTYRNTETHWWDASQVYGSTAFVEDMLRTRRGGKLVLTDEQLLPFNPATFVAPPGVAVNLAGSAGNWWVGLALMHTVFMREHNAICDRLAAAYPQWTDDQLFDHARLINAAQIVKIHTIEWTTALLSNPIMVAGMRANWFGLAGERVKRRFGRLSTNEEISGIVGSRTFHHGAAYAMTEEFVSVYRMHPLIPDDFEFRAVADNSRVDQRTFNEVAQARVDDLMAKVPIVDLLYSLGIAHPGAIVLHNYPDGLRNLVRPDQVTVDLAAYDILRTRERGVPRYNDFRRRFHLKPAATFEEMSNDPQVVADLRRIYRDPEDVDLMVGLYAEEPPSGFAFSDTAFRVFTLMASRRIKSDRFYTYDYRPEVYTPEGMKWIDDSSMSAVLLRHYPELAPALHGVTNAFAPWNVVGVGTAATSSGGLRRMSLLRRLSWGLRRRFWNGLARFKFAHNKPAVIPVPVADRKPVEAVPFVSKFPQIPIDRVRVADRVPKDEAQKAKVIFTAFQERMTRLFPPVVAEMPSVGANAARALDIAYTAKHRKHFPAPVRATETGLGELAVASPYSSYLHATGDGSYRWDLSRLRDFEVHPGLVPIGAVVDFQLDAVTGHLEPTRIDSALGTVAPGDRGWEAGERMAICSLTTHASLIRHYNWVHLTAGGPLAIVTRHRLPHDHPIRRLLWPHVYGTQYSNAIVTPVLLSQGGEFESIFSFTHRGMCELYEATTGEFDLGLIDPLIDAQRRGATGSGLATPALDNHRELFQVLRDHTWRYMSRYYASDDALADDQAFGAWLGDIARLIPGGVTSVMPGPVTVAGGARLLATMLYLTTVEHEITGSGVWDYQLWNDTSPVRIYRDGRRLPIDVYQRLVNANFNLNVHRASLMDDFSSMGVDAHGAAAFGQFHRDLLDLQAHISTTPSTPWRMEPKRLKANINA